MGIPGKNTKNVVQSKKLEVSSSTESKVMTKYISLDKLVNFSPLFSERLIYSPIWHRQILAEYPGLSAAGGSSDEESPLSKEPEVEKMGRAPTEQELQEVDNSFAMIPVQLVDCKLEIKTLIVFFDSGSNINIV